MVKVDSMLGGSTFTRQDKVLNGAYRFTATFGDGSTLTYDVPIIYDDYEQFYNLHRVN